MIRQRFYHGYALAALLLCAIGSPAEAQRLTLLGESAPIDTTSTSGGGGEPDGSLAGVTYGVSASDFDGSYDADALLNVAGSVCTQPSWGSGDDNRCFTVENTSDFIGKGTLASRDMAVVGWSRRGRIFARLDAISGRALYIEHNGDSPTVSVRLGDGIADGSAFPSSYTEYWSTSDPATDIPGYVQNATEGDRFRLTADGTLIRAEFHTGDGNWSTFYEDEYAAWVHMEEGVAAWSQMTTASTHGHREMRVSHLTDEDESYHSDFTTFVDSRDFGLKSLTATGSIATGSNEVTLESNPGFAVGDPVIVETNKLRGDTLAVGDAVPTIRVDEVEDLYELDEETGTLAYVRSAGNNYEKTAPNPTDWSSRVNFTGKAQPTPKSLVATVTAIDGNTLTLDTTAAYGESGVAVHYDAARSYLVSKLLQRPAFSPDSLTVRVHGGTFNASNDLRLAQGSHGWSVIGSGIYDTVIRTPRGIQSVTVRTFETEAPYLSDMSLEGNYTDTTLYLDDAASGFFIQTSPNARLERLRVRDFANSAYKQEGSDSMWVDWSQCSKGDGNAAYIQWSCVQASLSTGGGFRDVRAIGENRIEAAFEPFWSTNWSGIRGSGINLALLSHNGSTATTYEDMYLRFEEGAGGRSGVPTLGFNRNAGGGEALTPNYVRNLRVVYDGPLGGTDDWPVAIDAAGFGNINVEGGLFWTPPAYRETAFARAISLNNVSGGYHVVDGFLAFDQSSSSVIRFRFDSEGEIVNSIAETIDGGANATLTNNQTLTAWQAGRTNVAPLADFECEQWPGTRTFMCSSYTVEEETKEATYLTSDDAGIIRYEWELLDGAEVVATDRLPWWTFQAPAEGTYTVRFRVQDTDEAWSGWASCTLDTSTGLCE